ncbi:hypothetical protein DFP72DRAFT_1061810 [Ephemerocybe angulata]|uniref:MYND-type domain-containing protein n=1 Tax=Ephemerocybe angulata TaxID=980116 RepID=A0A8H6MAW4_9AGAR|nr:hypothetical protein DFP72DRAFT_1061810 [Tulosesus angulatus]
MSTGRPCGSVVGNSEITNGPIITRNHGRPIPDYVLAAAKNTLNLETLTKLFWGLSPESFRPELLDVLFHHLQPDRRTPPPPLTSFDSTAALEEHESSRLRRLQIGKFCLSEGLRSVLKNCPQSQLEQIVQTILPHLENIGSWLNFFASGPTPYNSVANSELVDPGICCTVLVACLELGNKELARRICSDGFADYSIHSWCAIQDSNNRADLSFGYCHAVDFFSAVMKSENGRQRVMDILCHGADRTCRSLRGKVLSAASARCRHIAMLDRELFQRRLDQQRYSYPDPVALSVVMDYLAKVLDIVQNLVTHPMLSRSFLKSNFFASYCQAIQVWLVKKCDIERDPERRWLAYGNAALAQIMIDMEGKRSSANWKLYAPALLSIVKSGFINILLVGMGSNSKQNEDGLFIAKCLGLFRNQCSLHPRLAKSLASALQVSCGEAIDVPDYLAGTGYEEYWGNLIRLITAGSTITTDEKSHLCDYLNCPGNQRTFSPSKSCVGCHSVTYCSHECQTADWKAFHREECEVARGEYIIGLQANRPHYFQHVRLFQAELTARRARLLLASDTFIGGKDGLSEGPCVLDLGTWAAKYQTCENFIKYQESPHYLDSRVKALVFHDDFKIIDSQFSLIQAQYHFGGQKLVVLCKVQQDKSVSADAAEEFKVLYCVTKFLGPVED